MRSLPDGLGLYIHIPFCIKKCKYCDFYSACFFKSVYKEYFAALIREIRAWGEKTERPVDTVYIGGGTPSVMSEDIIPLLCAVRESFLLSGDAEITTECNPASDVSFLKAAKSAGVNRLSIGVQSGDDGRLKALGRTHTAADAAFTVNAARQAGFDNISLDIMLALPESTVDSALFDAEFICSLSPEHVSAYILKIEPNTAFFALRDKLKLPDDEQTARQYLAVCGYLRDRGYSHYEISNFARGGRESRHNLKYWRCEEYLGIGPSAHSFISGKRFYYPRDIKAFTAGAEPLPDGTGGEREERIMLGLRLDSGVPLEEFGADVSVKAQKLQKAGLLSISDGRISLTDEGMLVSNSVITELLL